MRLGGEHLFIMLIASPFDFRCYSPVKSSDCSES